jgi:hypothetical protein
MALADLLSRLTTKKPDVHHIQSVPFPAPETRHVTAVTGSNVIAVTPKPAWIGACTAVTAVTSQTTNALRNAETVEPIADTPGNLRASFQAEIAVDRNSSILPTVADTDDRRPCTQCLNLRGRACAIAKPERGALVVANVGYHPQPDTLHRCAGYQPNATDNDQRPGGERWPGLTDTKGTK